MISDDEQELYLGGRRAEKESRVTTVYFINSNVQYSIYP